MEYTLNKESLLESPIHDRFKGAPWFDLVKSRSCFIGGAGGIGSWLCLLLGRTGVKRNVLVDPDMVELHNLGGQLYSMNQIGKHKVRAIQHLCFDLGSIHVSSYTGTVQEFHDANNVNADTWFLCFDNMEARRYMFSKFKEKCPPREAILIDGRLTADEFQVFCVPSWDTYSMERYENESSFSDEEATPSICTFKQTSYMAAMIGSVMVNTFIRAVQAQEDPNLRHCLPFKISYNSNTMEFKKEI